VLKKKKIILGITGGIAAYKIPQLVRDFINAGATIRSVMTDSATEFVTPLALSTVTGNDVIVGNFPSVNENLLHGGTWHIEFAQWADVMLIAPATANTVAKIAHGYADNAITTLALAMRCPVVIVPSMDTDMWKRSATQANITILKERGYIVLPPAEGELASGLIGAGRLPDIPEIVKTVDKVLQFSYQDLKGKKILISAGPTYEPIDPVRFVGNRSSGKMGFAIANAAAQRGADVTLVTGRVKMETPRNVKRIDAETAEQMFSAIMKKQRGMDAVIMAAAVADFCPVNISVNKIKKENFEGGNLILKLKRTKDILQSLAKRKSESVLVGFAIETEKEISNAKKKLKSKNLDLIIVNNPMKQGAGFEVDTNIVTIISKRGKVERLPKMTKYDVAQEILTRVAKLL